MRHLKTHLFVFISVAVAATIFVASFFYLNFTLIPLTNPSSLIMKNLIIFQVCEGLGFLLVLLLLIVLLRKNEFAAKADERFRIVTNQTHTVVFDYDFARKRLELTGNVRSFIPYAKDFYEVKSISKLFDRVHKDDVSFVHEMSSLRNDVQTSVLREVRLKCVNGIYYWYRLSGTIVRNEADVAIRFVGNLVNVDDEMNKEQQLMQKVDEDPLTGLLNKAAFEERVTRKLSSAKLDDLYAFYVIDLDNFKKVNDTLGHIVGDRVLMDTARKLSLIFSACDYVGRIGGDEFAAFLMLSENARGDGKKLIESKAKAVCSKLSEVYFDGVNEIRVTASVGVSLYPVHGVKYAELYKNADSILYGSKKAGKNRYQLFS